jgi:hypothetical protein
MSSLAKGGIQLSHSLITKAILNQDEAYLTRLDAEVDNAISKVRKSGATSEIAKQRIAQLSEKDGDMAQMIQGIGRITKDSEEMQEVHQKVIKEKESKFNKDIDAVKGRFNLVRSIPIIPMKKVLDSWEKDIISKKEEAKIAELDVLRDNQKAAIETFTKELDIETGCKRLREAVSEQIVKCKLAVDETRAQKSKILEEQDCLKYLYNELDQAVKLISSDKVARFEELKEKEKEAQQDPEKLLDPMDIKELDSIRTSLRNLTSQRDRAKKARIMAEAKYEIIRALESSALDVLDQAKSAYDSTDGLEDVLKLVACARNFENASDTFAGAENLSIIALGVADNTVRRLDSKLENKEDSLSKVLELTASLNAFNEKKDILIAKAMRKESELLLTTSDGFTIVEAEDMSDIIVDADIVSKEDSSEKN